MTDPNPNDPTEIQDDAEGEDEIDPLDPLRALSDELNHPQTGHRVRVESIAKSLKQELAAIIPTVNSSTPEGAAILKLADICAAVLEEQAGTSMASLADFASMVVEVVEDVRGDLDDLEEAAAGGEGEVVFGLHPDDAGPIRTLLLEYRDLVLEIGKTQPAQAEMVRLKLGDIDRVLTRVNEIELHPLNDDAEETEDAGDAAD